MADKRRTRQSIRRLQRVKTWQLVTLLILTLLLAATFLRLNNIGMIERRTAVLSADEAGDEQAVKNNLHALQRHAAAHMNASSGVLYLQESYRRDVKQVVEKTRRASEVNQSALDKADRVCRARYPGYSQAYVQCNAAEQAKYQGNSGQAALKFPNTELYRHEFASPAWSPDFAGWTLLICVLITLVIALRGISLLTLKLLLRRHYSSV